MKMFDLDFTTLDRLNLLLLRSGGHSEMLLQLPIRFTESSLEVVRGVAELGREKVLLRDSSRSAAV
jgi:hypothetical protein